MGFAKRTTTALENITYEGDKIVGLEPSAARKTERPADEAEARVMAKNQYIEKTADDRAECECKNIRERNHCLSL